MSLSDQTLALIDAAFAARDQAAVSAADAAKLNAAVIAAQTAADRGAVLAATDAQNAASAKQAAVAAVEQELSSPPVIQTAKAKAVPMSAAAQKK